MYGSGWDVLFRHVDDDGDPWVVDPVHEWTGREVGYTPLSLIAQVAESSRHGYIVPSATPPPGTPPAYLATPPRTRAQITFMAGDHNNMFRWQGQHRAARVLRGVGGSGAGGLRRAPGLRPPRHLLGPGRSGGVVPGDQGRPGMGARHPPPHEVEKERTRTMGDALPPRRGRIFSRGTA